MTGAAEKKPRRRKLLVRLGLGLCAAFLAVSAVWYGTAYRPYEEYLEACRELPDWKEEDAFRGAGRDAEGFSLNVKRPGFLSWTGNLGLSMPALATEDGEEVLFTDALIIWPLAGGGTEQGVILYEYEVDEEGVSCTGHQLYIDREGNYLPYGDAAEDAANQALLESRRETVQTLLDRARDIWGLP